MQYPTKIYQGVNKITNNKLPSKSSIDTASLVIGIHDGHNSSVALLKEGKLIDVLQEERFSRVKNAGNFPEVAANDIISRNNCNLNGRIISLNGLYMSYGIWDKDTILQDYENSKSLTTLVKAKMRSNKTIFSLYKSYKTKIRTSLLNKLLSSLSSSIQFVEHHTAHAAAAYYGWGKKDKVLVLTCDGCGDELCATISIGDKGKLERIASISEDNSLGRLYAFITYLMGMMPLEHEYKIMGLAPYCAMSKDVKRLYDKFNSLFEFKKENNGITWQRKSNVPSMYAPNKFIDNLIYRERFDWIAAGLQLFMEDFLKEWVRNCIRETGIRKIALSGGVFMNVKANKAIYELPEVEEIFIFPSCGDESNAIGAAYHAFMQNGGANIEPLSAIYFGEHIRDEDVNDAIKQYKMKTEIQVEYKDNIEKTVAELLAKGEIVGRVKGKMEFGARALGNRSILANPSNPRVIRIINEMIKCRDFWMPFAPSVLAESSEKYFVKPKPVTSPYMMLTFDTKPEVREKIMDALHPFDYTARPQEVIEDWNPDYYKLIKYYEDLTGESIILNTSYNLHGYPIAYTPRDALDVFNNSGLNFLALGNFLIWKEL